MGTNNFISKVTPLGSATTYTVKDPIAQETILGTQTASTASWTGKSNYINELYDGLTIRYYLPFAGTSTSATLNLTLADDTTTGAIACYYSPSTRLTTHYPAGSVIEMTYFSAGSIKVSGTATTNNRWIAKANYYSNTDTKVTQAAAITTNGNYPIIIAYSTATSSVTNTVNKASAFTYNPGTKTLTINGGSVTASTFTGALAGKADSAGVADSANAVDWSNISNKPSSYYTLPVATSSSLGGVKIGYTTNNTSRNYAVELDSQQMFVNVPWENTITTVSTTGDGNAITSITATNGAITATKGATFLTTHQTVSNKNATLGWATATTVATIGGTDIKVSLPANPNTNTTYTFADGTTNGTFKVTPSTTSTAQVVTIYGLTHNAFSSTTYAPVNSPTFTGTPTAPTPNSTSGTTAIATKGYVDSAFAANDAMIYKGTIGGSGSGATITSLPATHNAGWTYRVITAGTYAGVKCEIGDLIICNTDGTTASDTHWNVVQTNIDGAVIGPATSTNANIAIFDGTTGKLIADSGFTIAKSVPADAKFTDTTYTFDGTYNASTNKAATVSSITSRIEALDGTITGTPSASQTLTAFSQTDGKVSATFGDISITKSQISDFDHNHGNINMAGIVSATATIASGDRLLITDSSTANRVVASGITFDGSTKTKALTQAGTWESFNNYSLPTASSTTKGGIKVGTTLAISSEVLNLASVTVTTATSTTSPAHSGTFTAIDSVTVDSYGRVTGYNTKTVTLPSDNNTTYTFTSGTNGFTVKPSNSTSTQTVTVTPSIANNITGSGTSGYLAKFNSSNTIEDGVAFGSDTTTYLRNDGTWASPSNDDTKNTAGSTQDINKLFMIGAKSQTANAVTYSHTAVYATAGAFAATSYKVAEKVTLQYNNTTNALDFIFA